MAGYQRPAEPFGADLDEEFRKVMEESPAVGVLTEDIAAVGTMNDHVLEKAGEIMEGMV